MVEDSDSSSVLAKSVLPYIRIHRCVAFQGQCNLFHKESKSMNIMSIAPGGCEYASIVNPSISNG